MKMDYSNIGFINFKTKVTKLNFNATGVLISDTLVLTSAHTFINRSDIEQTVELCEPVRFHYRLHGNYAKEAEYEIEAYRVNEIYKSIML
jgi:V8-like Glu-specific endopeptidase